MIKMDFKWDYKVEKRLFNFFRRTAFSIFSGKKIDVDYSNLMKIFVNYSISYEKKFKKPKDIDVKKHTEIAVKQIKEIKDWQNNLNNYIEENKEKIDLKDKLSNNAKFRARNMLGNYYKDFLREIIAIESEYFEWNTMGDERVRPTHEARDGVIYNWDNAEIVPGEEAACRCWATVYFPDTKEEIENINQNS
ncbi:MULTISPECIES: minor capsid protein [unclassified Leptotrichia]|jgi:hypothetical protein|uniref:minor capsid protein n=1 Tax=unclassified Leptotrichia TaxID=2633022 RepID=UPI0003ADA1C0|nr:MULTISPECIES: minor capsid protein [unclassified Leptotrichia]ERL03469.1 hypothetical protein HMPREF9108_02315 [Leptotrichia sp. oral taxon 225 str. F0581]WLD74931.1 minor capsid protein [Leptotrichia sp. HMT-225]